MPDRSLPTELRITRYGNQVVKRTRFEVRYADPEHPLYEELRQRYRLDEVVGSQSSQFGQLVALRDWLRGRWAHGWDGTRLITSGLEVLRQVEQGKELHCWYFTMAFCACASALGFQARPVAIGKASTDFIPPDEVNISHVTAEAWSNTHGKWVVMDTDANCHYERAGVPLSAYEVRMAWLQGEAERVTRVTGPTPAAITTRTEVFSDAQKKALFDTFFRHDVMDYYHYLRFLLRMDLVEASEQELGHLQAHATSLAFGQPGLPAAQWLDEHSPPQLYMENWPVPPDLKFTACLDDVYWTLNQAEIGLRCAREPSGSAPPLLQVTLDTVTPSFGHFEVRLGAGAWERKPSRFDWPLRQGRSLIAARAVNKRGLHGPLSAIEVSYKP